MGMATRNPAPVRRGLVGLIVVASVALALTTATSDGVRNQTGMRRSILAGSTVPVPVREILQRACQNCHSENTIWPWYAQIPPISRQIHSDVAKARAFMDLSKWNDYTEGERRGFTAAIGAATWGFINSDWLGYLNGSTRAARDVQLGNLIFSLKIENLACTAWI